MQKSQNQQNNDPKQLPMDIAEMPERQRETMQEARKKVNLMGKNT